MVPTLAVDGEKGVVNLSMSSQSVPEGESNKPRTKAEASLLTKIVRTELIVNENDVEEMQSNLLHPPAKLFEELHL